MKNYTRLRFARLYLYFFAVYGLLTSLWYAVTGRFGFNVRQVIEDLLLNATLFSLLFTLLLLLWYRRTRTLVPTTQFSKTDLQKNLAEIGYEEVKSGKKTDYTTYKPVPPKASAMAGKVFMQKTANFYILEGPARLLKHLKKTK